MPQIKTYGGLVPPSFLYTDVSYEVLPPNEINSLEIPFKSGAYYLNRKRGVRTFKVDLSVVADKKSNLMYYVDDLAEWLDYDEPQPLVLEDKPDQTYYAILSGSSDLDQFAYTGKASVTLICYDPHAKGNEKIYTFAPQNTDPIIYTNLGNKATYPKLEMTFTKNLTDFAIVSGDEQIIFGDFDVTNDIATDLKPLYIDDTGSTTTGWTTATTVDGGDVVNTITSNGYTFQQGSKDYGTGSLWHGGSLVKSLGKQVQNFLLSCRVGFTSSNINQLGRVEFYLLDINGKKIGKMAMRDNHATADLPNFEAWAGGVGTGGVSFRNTYGNYTGQYKGGFDGILRIGRDGKKWYCYIAKLNSKNQHIKETIMYKEYWDRELKYQDKVAAIQIHIGAYKTYAPVNNMWISNIRFFEELKATGTQKGYVFKTGDKLEIDCEEGEILKNGEPYYEELYASSKFLKFEKGTNGVSVSDTGFKDGKLSFVERWL